MTSRYQGLSLTERPWVRGWSEAEAHRCKWAATVNWTGGARKNIDIDLFQENGNAEMKKLKNQWERTRWRKLLPELARHQEESAK